MHGRDLILLTHESRQHFTHARFVKIDRAGAGYFAFAIERSRDFTQLDRGPIAFVGIQHALRELGGLAKTQRQEAGRKWIEHAGMPAFFCRKQPATFLQSAITRKTKGLVEQEHAINLSFGHEFLRYR